MPVQVCVLEDETLIGDIIVQAKTGSGETLAFALPLINSMAPNQRNRDTKFSAPPASLLSRPRVNLHGWVLKAV